MRKEQQPYHEKKSVAYGLWIEMLTSIKRELKTGEALAVGAKRKQKTDSLSIWGQHRASQTGARFMGETKKANRSSVFISENKVVSPPPPPKKKDNNSKSYDITTRSLPWTVNVADDVTTPRIFIALHVYIPPSCDVTSGIFRASRDITIRLSAKILEFCFSHVTSGSGFPVTSQWNEAAPVSFTTIDNGGDTIEGAEMVSPGSPLGPWGPWSPLGPGGPSSPSSPLSPFGPCSPRGPCEPCLPGGPLWPGLPRRPLMLFGQCALQASLLSACSISFLMMSSRLVVLLSFDFLFVSSKLRLRRARVSARDIAVYRSSEDNYRVTRSSF